MKTLAAKILKIAGILTLLFIVLVASVSCKKQTKKTSYSGPEYLEFGFSDKYNPLDPKEQSKTKSKYYFKPGTSFKGTYGIGSHFSKESSYHVIALLDYKQIPVFLDGSSNLIQKLTLAPNQKKLSKIETPPIKKGFHDFIMITFKSLDNHDVSDKYRFGETFFMDVRSNFITDNSKKREYPYSDFSRTAYRKDVVDGILVNQSKDKLVNLYKSKVKAGRRANFYIHLSNKTKHNKNYALVGFLDAKQIDIQDQKAIFTTIESKTRMVIPLNLKIDKKLKGSTHELTVIAIDSPGTKMDDKTTQALPGYDEVILESNRVALFIE